VISKIITKPVKRVYDTYNVSEITLWPVKEINDLGKVPKRTKFNSSATISRVQFTFRLEV
jgi:hypothetical protein